MVFSVADPETYFTGHVDRLKASESRGYAERVFATTEMLLGVITSKRWDILTMMAGAGELSIREVARRVRRDVKAVHGDVTALIEHGVIQRGPGGGVIFPYENLHLDLSYSTAA